METVSSIVTEAINMSTISTVETSPPTSENLMTPASVDSQWYIEQQKQQSSIISTNMLPPTSAATSGCNTIMSNSSSQIDLFAETPSLDTVGTITCSSSEIYAKDGVLDLSGTGLEKLNRAAPDYVLNTTTLLLDNNCLQRLDNIHTYQCLEKVTRILSAMKNIIVRVWDWVAIIEYFIYFSTNRAYSINRYIFSYFYSYDSHFKCHTKY